MSTEDIEDDIDMENPGAQLPMGAVEISLEDPVDEDEDDDEPSLSRREKRRHRGNKFREAREAYEKTRAELEAERKERQRLQQDLHSFRNEVYSYAQELEREPAESDLDRLNKEKETLARQWAAIAQTEEGKKEDTQNYYKTRYQKLEDERYRIIARQEAERTGSAKTPQQAGNPAIRYMAETEFPEVMGDQKALQWADAYHRQQMLKGRKNDLNLAKEAFEAARDEFKLGGRQWRSSPPSASERARYHGSPSAGSGRGGGDGKTFTMTPEFRALADAMYGDIKDERVRYQKWAREVWLKKK